MLVSGAIHVVVPLALAAWVAFRGPDSRLYLLAKIALTIPFFGMLWTGGSGWQIIGTFFRPLVGVGVLAGVLASFRWWSELPWWTGGWWPTGVLAGIWLLLGVFFAVNWATLVGGLQPPDAEQVDLAFPLTDGDYYVVWGGSHPATNRHMKVLDKKPDYRGQAYAYDIVELNGFGARANGLQPTDPSAYEIFGARVVAPCAGKVVRAIDDRPDVDAPTPDEDSPPEGNHVLLECGDHQVLLAHLQHDSLRVAEGDQLEVGDPVGLIGNSGNTTEPHLHVHAQRPADGEDWIAGDPLAITFGGEFVPKGTVVSR
jgi:hypothetical protein